MKQKTDLPILKTLQPGPTHGWDIARRIRQVSREILQADRRRAQAAGGRDRNLGALLLSDWADPTEHLSGKVSR